MAIQMAVFAFGSLLLLVAILGGGFEVKELKVPKVGRTSRIAASVCGLLFVFVGIRLDRPATAQPPAAAPQAQKNTDVASPALPQIVLVSLADQPALKVDEIAGQMPPQSGLGSVESRREGQETAAPAAPQQARPGTAKGEHDGQATGSSRTAGKPVPWEQKPRQWIHRLKSKPDAR